MKLISTTALSKTLNISSKELFNYFSDKGFIEQDGKSWKLTNKGEEAGGEYKESTKFGKYIVWPEDLKIDENEKINYITATAIGEKFEISANKINFILSELGWVNKGLKGWVITNQGKQQKGKQFEDYKSGIPYVKWPESIINTKALNESIEQVKGKESDSEDNQTKEKVEFREKFEAKHRSTDGHFVRSKAEMIIDNWLYMAEIVHAYERKLPIEEDVYCDFYIPTGKVYIEYWGYENEQKYLDRKNKKLEIYNKYGFNLIELKDEDVKNLDDVLPKMLLKFGVQAY